MKHAVDKGAIIDLSTLRTTLRGALVQYASDAALRRALIHAEGVVSDRMGERREVSKRSERRQSE